MSLTPRGAALLGGAIALLVIGVFRIDGALISIGVAGLLLMLVVMIMGRWNLAKLQVVIQAPARVFADTSFDFRLTLVNGRSLLDAHGIQMRLAVSERAQIHSHARWTAARSSATSKLRGSIPSRGAVSKHPCRLSSTFPLGVLEHRKQTMVQQEMLVFPKALVPKEFFSSGEFDDAWHGEGLQAGDSPGEPRGLRPARPGDPAKNIHWPATMRAFARGRAPRIREMDPPGLRPRRATVLFHSFGTDGTLIRTDYFERALSLLCGTLRHLRAIGIPASLSADFIGWKTMPTFQTDAWREALTTLARAERTADTEAHDLTAAIQAGPEGDALIIISDMQPDAWQQVLRERNALLIDVRQHKYGKKALSFRKMKATELEMVER
ncbi:hypothetical protein N9908_00035 [Akkermansiaceae bacterium]|nr:hypothetical protein [Akkermansiaceae bacterium]